MLELRPNCEWCDVDLPPDSTEARICSYECTYCQRCVNGALQGVCPNCGGFERRPVRPAEAWRPGTGLAHHPAGTARHAAKYTAEQAAELAARVGNRAPHER